MLAGLPIEERGQSQPAEMRLEWRDLVERLRLVPLPIRRFGLAQVERQSQAILSSEGQEEAQLQERSPEEK
jgi:hypothetical protein